jgi:formiminotetrahydrofolate cyclodeaminase
MKSDLEVARLMASASARGALANVEINLDGIHDAGYVAVTRRKVAELRERLGETSRSIGA